MKLFNVGIKIVVLNRWAIAKYTKDLRVSLILLKFLKSNPTNQIVFILETKVEIGESIRGKDVFIIQTGSK